MRDYEDWKIGCSCCKHDQECAEIDGRQEGKRWGAECVSPDSEPRFEYVPEESLGETPGSPETCPVNGWGCDECDYYVDCYPNWK